MDDNIKNLNEGFGVVGTDFVVTVDLSENLIYQAEINLQVLRGRTDAIEINTVKIDSIGGIVDISGHHAAPVLELRELGFMPYFVLHSNSLNFLWKSAQYETGETTDGDAIEVLEKELQKEVARKKVN